MIHIALLLEPLALGVRGAVIKVWSLVVQVTGCQGEVVFCIHCGALAIPPPNWSMGKKTHNDTPGRMLPVGNEQKLYIL